ncbi:MAG: CBS domain-containing protein [Candidatus Hadarchaeota archaeon]
MVVYARDFMTKEVATVDINASILEAAKLMTRKEVGSLVVVRGEKPMGLITDRDILVRAVVEGLKLDTATVEKIMSQPLLTVGPETPMLEVAKIMDEHSIRRVPVVEEGHVVGIVTSSDIGRASKILAPYLLPRIPEIYLTPRRRKLPA